MLADLFTLLELRAGEHPEKIVFTFLLDGEDAEAQISYAQLLQRAQRVASLVQASAVPGDRAILLYPPGLDYIAAFFGCLAAGVIAVPAYPPDPSRLKASLPRLQAIVEDARPRLVLTLDAIYEARNMVLDLAPRLSRPTWIATDGDGDASSWRRHILKSESIAFLQYTSGSTAEPKGVMLSHRALLHNLAVIQKGMRIVKGVSSGVGWLPPYHDMGLIGKILTPVFTDIPCTLMSPLDFLQQPFRWLRAITKYRATISGGPNFAYDLCVRRITPQQRESLDLRSWAVAFNGAEPLRADTFERFTEAFAPCGFDPAAFYPCYGLAESTLMCTGSEGASPLVRRFLGDALERGRAVLQEEGRRLVSSGRTEFDLEIAIVEGGARCAEGLVGEIWVRGSSLASGYWGNASETERCFRAKLEGVDWLRTGDLGFMDDGELFVTGRVKDLIIVHGRKLHPQDIEATVERSTTGVRPGCSAAFAVNQGGREGLAIVAEFDDRKSKSVDEVLGAVRQAVAEHHQAAVDHLVLIEARTIPKTSSGKIRRFVCRDAMASGGLEAVASWSASEGSGERRP